MMKYKKILVIDDRREVRLLISTALRNLPYDVIEATCGEEGLAILEIKRPDLIFLDILMPGNMDGLAVCRKIKRSIDWAIIPVVIMTTMGQVSDKEAAFLAGADAYIIKPFSIEFLHQIARQFLGDIDD
jgi:two-component system phosphate regulon response regulator PhoB